MTKNLLGGIFWSLFWFLWTCCSDRTDQRRRGSWSWGSSSSCPPANRRRSCLPPSLPAQTEKREKKHTYVANSRQISRPIQRINFAQLKNSAPSLSAQTIQRGNQSITMWPTLGKFPAYSAGKFSSAEKFGSITASSNWKGRKKPYQCCQLFGKFSGLFGG